MRKLFATLLLAAMSSAALAQGGPQGTVSAPNGTISTTDNNAKMVGTVGTTSVAVIGAIPGGRAALMIQLNTASATLTCNPTGPAVLATHPGITISGLYATLNFASFGAIPNTAVECISDSSGRDITVWAFPQ